MKSSGSPNDKSKEDLALRHLKKNTLRAYNQVKPTGGNMNQQEFSDFLLTMGVLNEKNVSPGNQQLLLSRCFEIASSFVVEGGESNTEYANTVSVAQADVLMLLICGYKKTTEVKYRISRRREH